MTKLDKAAYQQRLDRLGELLSAIVDHAGENVAPSLPLPRPPRPMHGSLPLPPPAAARNTGRTGALRP